MKLEMRLLKLILIPFLLTGLLSNAQTANPFLADVNTPIIYSGLKLAWSDEFNVDGKPNTDFCNFIKR